MFRSLGTGPLGVQVASLADGLDLAARHGFAGYHFSSGEVAAIGAGRARELAEEKGVRLSGWGFPLDFRGDRAPLRRGFGAIARAGRSGGRAGRFAHGDLDYAGLG